MDILSKRMTVEDFISLLGDEFPLLKEYESTEQEPLWHAEGNVLIHTNMVMSEAYQLIEEKSIDDESAIILILAALFHDYGKPISTKLVLVKDVERTGAPNHEEKGASLLLFCKPPLSINQEVWGRVLELVAYHHIPKQLVVREAGIQEYAKLTRRVKDIKLLYLLEVADMRGRICPDRDLQLEIMELFKLFCIEYNVWNEDPYKDSLSLVVQKFPEYKNPRWIACQMASRYEDGQIHMLEEELSRAYGYMDSQSHLVVMCGLPGSGKSTYIKENFANYEIVSLDEIREELAKCRTDQSFDEDVVRLAHVKLKDLLRLKKNIIWDATNFRKDFRSKICQMGYNYKAFVEIVFIHKTLELILKQNKARTHVVPYEAIKNQILTFQRPDIDECHELTVVI
jgi:predicted kinase